MGERLLWTLVALAGLVGAHVASPMWGLWRWLRQVLGWVVRLALRR